MVSNVTVIIAINCHQVSNNRLTIRGWCGRAAPRSREGERDNCCVSGGLKDRSTAVAGDGNEEVVEDLEVENKKELVDGYVGIRSASNRYPSAL